MGKLRDTIIANLSWSILLLLGISAVALWSLLQEDLVQLLLSNPSKSIFALGWIIAILLLLLTGAIAGVVYLRRLLNDPFKNYQIDSMTETVIDPKTGNRFCPTCMSKHKKSPVILRDKEYLCVNRYCPNSKEGFKVLFSA